jgi:hypothetical protein
MNMKKANMSWSTVPQRMTRQLITFLSEEMSQAKAMRMNIPEKLIRLYIFMPGECYP